MTPGQIPQELLDILDRAAGKEHSRSGGVAAALAEILTRHEETLDADRIIGLAELADGFGLTRTGVENLRKNKTFPAPDDRPRCGPVWRARRVRVWAETHGREWKDPAGAQTAGSGT